MPIDRSTPPLLPDRLVSITAVADVLGVEVRHVRRLVAERRIPFIKWGHLLRFDPLELAAWIDEHRLGVRTAAMTGGTSHRTPTMTSALGPRRSLGLQSG